MERPRQSSLCCLHPQISRDLQIKTPKKVHYSSFRSCKIFKHFSEYLTKRTPSQCRSHFQKLMLKHKTVAKLKREYRDKFGDVAYQDEMARLQEHLASKKKDIDGDAQVERKEIGIQTEGGHENHCSGLHSGTSNFSFVYAMNGLGLLPFPPPTWASLNCPFL